eukprot:scaffold2034_cov270-Chaetoceros_neogracile.AAC.3
MDKNDHTYENEKSTTIEVRSRPDEATMKDTLLRSGQKLIKTFCSENHCTESSLPYYLIFLSHQDHEVLCNFPHPPPRTGGCQCHAI